MLTLDKLSWSAADVKLWMRAELFRRWTITNTSFMCCLKMVWNLNSTWLFIEPTARLVISCCRWLPRFENPLSQLQHSRVRRCKLLNPSPVVGCAMLCGLVWIPTPFSSFRCTFCLNTLNNLLLQLYCPKNQRAILSWVLHCLLFDRVTTAYCQLSFSAFLSRVSSVLHNFPLWHLAVGMFAGFKCEITERVTGFLCACTFLRLYCYHCFFYIPVFHFVLLDHIIDCKMRRDMNEIQKSKDISLHVEAAWLEIILFPECVLICKTRVPHYVKQEFQGISVTWKEKRCSSVAVLSGELVPALGSLCDFEKFCKTSSSHALC